VFKDWITGCHRDLDKVTRFEKLAGPELQACPCAPTFSDKHRPLVSVLLEILYLQALQ